jgi:dihydrofolate synthase/folylpolyglutamate synthase
MPSPEPTLADWLARLERGHPDAVDLGLERVAAVYDVLGRPRPGRTVVTVAGTNGKGSTVAVIDAVARATGLRCGTTTSPHLIRFNERIAVDGRPADDATIVAAFERVEAARATADVSLTYFEVAILAALDVLARADLDLAVLEVGLGGRLDAVNVVDADAAVITPVDLDHQGWLGDDRETIGAEKAGVLRAGALAVLGDPSPPSSVRERARSLGCRTSVLGEDFAVEPGPRCFRGRRPDGGAVRIPLPVTDLHDGAVAAGLQALVALDRLDDPGAVTRALAGLRLAGRMDRRCHRGLDVIVDVAHNPHAARALAARLAAGPRRQAILGTFEDKDARAMVEALAPVIDGLWLVDTPGPRGRDAAALDAALGPGGPPRHVVGDVGAALEAAAALGAPLLVAGSFTVAGAALELLESPAE